MNTPETLGFASLHDVGQIVKAAERAGLLKMLAESRAENGRTDEIDALLVHLDKINTIHVVLHDVQKERPEIGIILDINIPVAGLLTPLLQRYGFRRVGEKAKVDVYVYKLGGEIEGVCEYIFLAGYRNRCYISNDHNLIEAIVAAEQLGLRDSLADSEEYRSVSSDFRDSGLVVYASRDEIIRAIERDLEGRELREFQKHIYAYGLTDVKNVGLSINRDGTAASLSLSMNPQSRVSLFLSQEKRAKSLANYIPSDARFFLASGISDARVTWVHAKDYIFNMLRSENSRYSRREFENHLMKIESDWGLRFDDVLSLLDGEIGIFLGGEFPWMTVAATVRDSRRAQVLMERMFDGGRIRRKQYEGVEINTAWHVRDTLMAWAIVDNVFLISGNEEPVKSAVRARRRGEALKRYPPYRQSVGRLPSENVVQAYFSFQQIIVTEEISLADLPIGMRRWLKNLCVSASLTSAADKITLRVAPSEGFRMSDIAEGVFAKSLAVLHGARESARRASCMNNVRSL